MDKGQLFLATPVSVDLHCLFSSNSFILRRPQILPFISDNESKKALNFLITIKLGIRADKFSSFLPQLRHYLVHAAQWLSYTPARGTK